MQKTKSTKIKMSTGEKIFSVINYIFLALVAAACLYPMLYVLFASFSNSNQLMRHTGIRCGRRVSAPARMKWCSKTR